MRSLTIIRLFIFAAFALLSGSSLAQNADDGKTESGQDIKSEVPVEASNEAQSSEAEQKETQTNPEFRPSEEISEDSPVPFPIDI